MAEKPIGEIVLWADRDIYTVSYSPSDSYLHYRIKIPLKQLEKGYIKSKAKQLEGLT